MLTFNGHTVTRQEHIKVLFETCPPDKQRELRHWLCDNADALDALPPSPPCIIKDTTELYPDKPDMELAADLAHDSWQTVYWAHSWLEHYNDIEGVKSLLMAFMDKWDYSLTQLRWRDGASVSVPVGLLKTIVDNCTKHIEYGDNEAEKCSRERADAGDFYKRAAQIAVEHLSNIINGSDNHA